MTSKPVKTVSATCACGVKFDREVKRGRPQVWCPACVAVPFYERTNKPAAPVTQIDATQWTNCGTCGIPHNSFQNCPVEAAPERIVNENDRLDHVRVDIEAGMVLINADHKVRFATLVAEGMDPVDAGAAASVVTLAASQNLYADLAPKFYTPGREVDDA